MKSTNKTKALGLALFLSLTGTAVGITPINASEENYYASGYDGNGEAGEHGESGGYDGNGEDGERGESGRYDGNGEDGERGESGESGST